MVASGTGVSDFAPSVPAVLAAMWIARRAATVARAAVSASSAAASRAIGFTGGPSSRSTATPSVLPCSWRTVALVVAPFRRYHTK